MRFLEINDSVEAVSPYLKSPAIRPLAQHHIQANDKKIKVPHNWPVKREATGDKRILFTKGKYCGKGLHDMTSHVVTMSLL